MNRGRIHEHHTLGIECKGMMSMGYKECWSGVGVGLIRSTVNPTLSSLLMEKLLIINSVRMVVVRTGQYPWLSYRQERLLLKNRPLFRITPSIQTSLLSRAAGGTLSPIV